MTYIVMSWLLFVAALVVCIAFNHPLLKEKQCFSDKAHRIFCISVFAIGCLIRILKCGSLPNGPTAEEALVAIQGKALWQTGGFAGIGHLTAQLYDWEGESNGPLLATLTAPFVGLFGINAWTARIPLVLLSIAAMLAMYGVGYETEGKTAGRYALTIEALCPYYILGARLTASANAALYLLPIAFYFLLCGMKKTGFMYAGLILTALMAYTQDLYFYISPVFLLVVVIVFLVKKKPVIHTLIAGFVGFMIVVPAILTAMLNYTGGETYTLFNVVEIPKLNSFDKANWLGQRMAGMENPVYELLRQFWRAVISGGVFQKVAHENISYMLIEPDGFYALYSISFPLMLLGLLSGLHVLFSSKGRPRESTILLISGGIVTATMILLFGSIGREDLSGTTYCYDYSSMFFYDALFMINGFVALDKKSRVGVVSMLSLMTVNLGFLCLFLFGGDYTIACNVNFPDFRDASVVGRSAQEKTGDSIMVSDEVFPHLAPDEAASYLYMYSIDADMRYDQNTFTVYYPPAIEQPDSDKIHIVKAMNTINWNLDEFDYQEFGEYAVLIPLSQNSKQE